MFALGAICSGGHGGEPNPAAAERWFRAAAELGHGAAQMMLGRYLMAGVTHEPTPDEGRQWLERAAAQGVSEAQADINALA